MSYRWLLLFCLLFPVSARAANVRASLDRNEVHLGETVTLSLHIDGNLNVSTPDLSALSNDFEVLGIAPAPLFGDDNGRTSVQLVIGIELRPKHVGDLQIPSLTFAGSQTTPLTLRVDPPEAATAANGDRDFFISVSVDSTHGYVGQQLALTMRFFYRPEISEGMLPDPQPIDADFYRLGQERNYEREVNGRRYHVVERNYAVIPRRSGKLTIPSVEFKGEAVDAVNPNDPGNFLSQGGIFGNTTPVTADSSPVTVNVQATPADWGSTTWLPARSLMLKLEGLPGDDKAQVGQPLNLRMTMEVVGLPAEALPQLSLPAIDGATVYPDQSTDATHDDGQWLAGHRERGFAIFPQHPGPLAIPAITLTWFNVQTGQKQVTSIPAHTLTVLPAANGASATASSTTQAAAPSVAPASASSVSANAPASLPSATPWRWIAIGSVGLWAFSAIVFWWWRGRKPGSSTKPVVESASGDSIRSSRHAFMEAARGKDRSAQARRLLAWARSERPGLQNLGQVSAALASDAQRAAIDRLQRQQYAEVHGDDTTNLAEVFAQGFAWRSEGEAAEESPLPPLYPFKLD